jgi:hypothetical protein
MIDDPYVVLDTAYLRRDYMKLASYYFPLGGIVINENE